MSAASGFYLASLFDRMTEDIGEGERDQVCVRNAAHDAARYAETSGMVDALWQETGTAILALLWVNTRGVNLPTWLMEARRVIRCEGDDPSFDE
jgi:hypothetical protein